MLRHVENLRERRWRTRLAKHPALRSVPEEEAIKRLKLYTREERGAMQPWLSVATVLAYVCAFVFVDLLFFHTTAPGIMLGALASSVGLALVTGFANGRIRRRVREKIAADLAAGRAIECIECGYDLRGAEPERCPECGAPVGTVPGPRPTA